VNAIINALGTIVAGNISAMAQAVEGALNRILPVVISFLASLLGLGGISEKIRGFIEAVQEPVNKAIDWVINLGVSMARKIAGLFGGKKDEAAEEEPDDPEKQLKKDAALAALDQAEQRAAAEGVSREEAESIAAAVQRDHPVIRSIHVEEGEGVWRYLYTASPGAVHVGKQEATSITPPEGVIEIGENKWKISPPIEVTFNVRQKFLEAGLMDEYLTQLREQEAGINNMSVEAWENRRAAYEGRKIALQARRDAGEDVAVTGRDPQSSAAQARFRRNYQSYREGQELYRIANDSQYSHMSPAEQQAEADAIVEREMSEMHALHGPDQVAGGDPVGGIVRMGSARVNVSIGAQWRHAPREETRTVSEDDEPRDRITIIDTEVARLGLDADGKRKTEMGVRLRARFIE
jgi:hypothetical protein